MVLPLAAQVQRQTARLGVVSREVKSCKGNVTVLQSLTKLFNQWTDLEGKKNASREVEQSVLVIEGQVTTLEEQKSRLVDSVRDATVAIEEWKGKLEVAQRETNLLFTSSLSLQRLIAALSELVQLGSGAPESLDAGVRAAEVAYQDVLRDVQPRSDGVARPGLSSGSMENRHLEAEVASLKLKLAQSEEEQRRASKLVETRIDPAVHEAKIAEIGAKSEQALQMERQKASQLRARAELAEQGEAASAMERTKTVLRAQEEVQANDPRPRERWKR